MPGLRKSIRGKDVIILNEAGIDSLPFLLPKSVYRSDVLLRYNKIKTKKVILERRSIWLSAIWKSGKQ